ncbi:TonB-dependent hemoglobin/transferrin/lactoferrin family receptor [Microbulbifer sp. TYP-18]|uniref:TonB-dependent hemoglobin/transferrin/lactoferrin family receptor n=1 Tax=Microbulbifer sp. TYP-18 TaxID=3230024 RepID=UPI0034C68D6D
MQSSPSVQRPVHRHRMETPALTLLASSLLLATSPALATTVSELKSVVVSATRAEVGIDEVPRAVAVVDREAIQPLQPKSAAEVLRFQPNVAVSGGPRSGLQSVNIRGLSGNKVLQTVDGIRQDFNSGHRADYFLDPEFLSSIEVVKGPASSLWGSGAIGGVVAQSTLSARDLLSPDETLGGFVKNGFNDNNDQSTTSAAVAGRTSSVDWLLGGYYRDSNDIELGNGASLENSATRNNGLLAKAEWQVDDSQSVSINYRSADASGAVPSNGTAPLGSSNFLINSDQDTDSLILGYELDTASPLVNAHANVYWNNVAIDEERLSDGRADSTELDVYGFQLSNLSTVAGASLLYGVDGYHEDFNANRSGIDRPTPPEAETDVWGAFVQASIPLAEQWALELGARYDDFSSESTNLNVDNSDSEISPSAAIIWQTTQWMQLALRHDRAFRAPGSEELYTTGTHFCIGPPFGCNRFVSNPDLKPESAANTELLAKLRFNQLFSDDELRIDISAFQNKVDDFIEQIVTPPSFVPFPNAGSTTWQNVQDAQLEGFEIAADYQLDKLRLKLSYGQVRGEDDQTGRDLSNIPADTITADLNYAFLNDRLIAGIRAIDAATQSRTPDGRSFEGYTVGDIYASWQPSSLQGVKFGLTVNNLTDRQYQRAFEELPEAGREIIASVRFDL